MSRIISKEGIEITLGNLCSSDEDKAKGRYFYESRITNAPNDRIDTNHLSDLFRGYVIEGHKIIGLEMFMRAYQSKGSILNVAVNGEIGEETK